MRAHWLEPTACMRAYHFKARLIHEQARIMFYLTDACAPTLINPCANLAGAPILVVRASSIRDFLNHARIFNSSLFKSCAYLQCEPSIFGIFPMSAIYFSPLLSTKFLGYFVWWVGPYIIFLWGLWVGYNQMHTMAQFEVKWRRETK